jgi:sec-independent protein translocase protein TatA
MSFGPLEIIILIVIVVLLFGAKRLPELGSGLGGAIRNFGKGIKGEDDEPEELEQPPAEAPKRDASSRSTSS